MPKKEETTKTTKKPAAKKATAKKTTIKKTVAKKTVAKKTPTKPRKKSVTKKKSGGLSTMIGEEHKKARRVKISRKDLKKDELQEISVQVVNYLTAHGNKVLVIAALIIVVFLTLVLVDMSAKSKKETTSALFTRARQLYSIGAGEADVSTGTLESALADFTNIIKQYPTSVEASLSLYYIANVNYNLQQYEKAIDNYNKFLSTGIKNDTYNLIAKTNIAYSYENLGDYGNAVKILKELYDNLPKKTEGESSNDYISRSIAWDLGLAYENLKDIPEATAVYQKIIKNYPSSDFAEKAQERINSIQVK